MRQKDKNKIGMDNIIMAKRIVMAVGLAILVSQLGWTENIVLIQGTYMNAGRETTTDSDGRTVTESTNVSTAGLSMTGYWGESFGFLGSLGITGTTLAQPLSMLPGIQAFRTTKTVTTTDTGSESVSDEHPSGGTFGGVTITGDLGVGVRLGMGDMAFILGGGPHVNSLAEPGYSSWILGVGTQAIAILPIAEAFNFAVSLRLGYGFLEFARLTRLDDDTDDEVEKTPGGGLAWSLSLGVGFPIRG